jgi:hypothetical protein
MHDIDMFKAMRARRVVSEAVEQGSLKLALNEIEEAIEREQSDLDKSVAAKAALKKDGAPADSHATSVVDEAAENSKEAVVMSLKRMNLDAQVLEHVQKMDGDNLAKLVKHKHRAKGMVNTYITLIVEEAMGTYGVDPAAPPQ